MGFRVDFFKNIAIQRPASQSRRGRSHRTRHVSPTQGIKKVWFAAVHVQFSSVQSLDRLGRRGNMGDDSAGSFLQSFLLEALVSRCGTG